LGDSKTILASLPCYWQRSEESDSLTLKRRRNPPNGYQCKCLVTIINTLRCHFDRREKSAEGTPQAFNFSTVKFYSYITTNPNRDALYVGVTNNLEQRIIEHYLDRGKAGTHAGKYYCYKLVWYEEYQNVKAAIAREKEIKKWRREKKEGLIASFNPEWKMLNKELFGEWPLKDEELFHRKNL
jgi:putative endonuclease